MNTESSHKTELVNLIVDNLRQFDGEQALKIPANLEDGTTLFGRDGILDSMALVTLVVAVEQAIEDKFNVAISLADAKAMSQKHSPYRTIGSLAEYAERLIREG
jgi:acyl carrier protein